MRKHGVFVEFCCSDNSALKRVTEQLGIAYFGVTKSTVNLDDEEAFEQVLEWLQVEVQDQCGPVHLWGSVPHTAWSPWQNMALAKYGEPYRIKLEKKRELSRQYVIKFKQAADVVKMSRGGSVTFGWSKDSSGWKDPVVEQIMEALELTGVRVDGCSFNLQIHGKRPQRPWVIKTDNPKLLKELSTKVCKHPQGFHDHLEGSLTVKSGFYNVAMATCILATLYPGVMFDKVPAMPVVPFVQHEHREKHVFESMPSSPVLATTHKLS